MTQDLKPTSEFKRQEDFASVYANNVRFRTTAFDITITFGLLDRDEHDNSIIDQHTGITMSWLQAKVMSYFLQINLAVHEADNGNVEVPISLVPPIPGTQLPQPMDIRGVEAMERLNRIHRDFFLKK